MTFEGHLSTVAQLARDMLAIAKFLVSVVAKRAMSPVANVQGLDIIVQPDERYQLFVNLRGWF